MKKARIQIDHATRERMADTFVAGYQAGQLHERQRLTLWTITLTVVSFLLGVAVAALKTWAVALWR